MKKSIIYLVMAALVSLPAIGGAAAQKRNTVRSGEPAYMITPEGYVRSTAPAPANKKYKGTINFSEPVYTQTPDGMLEIDIIADLGSLDLLRQQAVILTPVLAVEDGGQSAMHGFESLVVASKARYKAMNREIGLGNFVFERRFGDIVRRGKDRDQSYYFTLKVPYEQWMGKARIVMIEEVSGCGGCEITRNDYALAPVVHGLPGYLPVEENLAQRPGAGFLPNFRLSLIMPPADTLKLRSETYSASLNFEQGRSVINRNLGNNSRTLYEVDRTVDNLRHDRNVSNIYVSVKGFASPEGDPARNMVLSRDRAMAFVRYLRDSHGFTEDMINFFWLGEDWAGLRAAVEKSGMADMNAVIRTIDYTSDPMERKAQIRALSGGRTYDYLLRNIYPSLRRNEYTITYTVRPFNFEETGQMYRTDPAKLSLYEMYRLASSYDISSYEFREIFDTAARVFPTDPTANINASALDIAIEADDVAISRIYTIGKPEAWNNLGIAYFKKGFYERAEEFFTKAAQAAEENAIHNLEQFNMWKAGNRQPVYPGVE